MSSLAGFAENPLRWWVNRFEGESNMSTFRVSSGQRRQMIAEAAYFRAERRGFDGADPVQDWIEAEVEVDAELRRLAREHIVERFEIALATATKQLAAFR